MLQPGDAIGILGGGQLARMMALAAAPLGLRCHIYAPEDASPAFAVADAHTCAAYDDEAALAAFADAVKVVTYEFENVPAWTADVLAQRVPVLPGPRALGITQDRLAEKSFLRQIGLPVADFHPVDDDSSLALAWGAMTGPAVLKTRRFGYDGKGQVTIRPGEDPTLAWQRIGRQPAIMEAFVPFVREVSVVAARGRDGTVVSYDVCENEHRDHILAFTRLPATLEAGAAHAAAEHAARIATRLDYVGVLAVEFFVIVEDGRERVVVNEIAPRVHNSGHWTIEGAQTSQFEQHVRAVAGWPLGAPDRLGAIEMENLVGAQAERWLEILGERGAHLHLYGKGEARPGRKMGHVTRVVR